MVSKLIDLTGQRFGRLTVLKRAGTSLGKKVLWQCQCDCGKIKIVQGTALKSGDTKSCGCLNLEQLEIANRQRRENTDGRSKTKLYWVWVGMRNRCNNPRNYSFSDYGGRGIRVCPEWDGSYDVFREWALSHGYKIGLSIDRIDNDAGYCPENCHWVDWKQQHRNQRVTRYITCWGERKPLVVWAEEMGISHGTLSARLNSGWSVEKALTEPVQKKKK